MQSTSVPDFPRRELAASYDYVVCGSGSSGCVTARRLAENSGTSVLLLEAGGTDAVQAVQDSRLWPVNLGSERDWGFSSVAEPQLNGRSMALSMGKVLGGGSSINVMAWARGHQADGDYFAEQAGDDAWCYESVLRVYRRIEAWDGDPDERCRGTGGPMFVQAVKKPNAIVAATKQAAAELGIHCFESANGRMMEEPEGSTTLELIIRNGQRRSVFRSYLEPVFHHPNLTIVTDAHVSRVLFDGDRAQAIEVRHDGAVRTVQARKEIVLALGAVNTPKLLMQSGLGPEEELQKHGIAVRVKLQGVGSNLQDHTCFGSIWQTTAPLESSTNGGEFTLFGRTDSSLSAPNLLMCQALFPVPSPQTAGVGMPEHGWTMLSGLAQPRSRGRILLTGPAASDPVQIQTNALSDPSDFEDAICCVELTRAIGNSKALTSFNRKEVLPASASKADLEQFVRNAASTFWHLSCSAKMGKGEEAVVDSQLRVHGTRNLRVADASVMPAITRGNTMAPCVVIGEIASERLLAAAH